MAKGVNESLDFRSAARIINLPAASSGDQPVRKAEFDATLAARDYIEEPVRAVATANINVASAPANPYDGVNLNALDRLFLTGQTTATENGIWVFHGAGAALTRSGDTYEAGTIVIVGPDGSAHANTGWIQTTDSPVVGVTALTFTQFGAVVSAGHGLTQTGNVIALATPVPVADGGTGASSAAAARASIGAAGVYTTQVGDGALTSFTINHSLGNKYCAVVLTNLSTGLDEDCTVQRNSANQLVLSAEGWTASPPALNAYQVTCIG